ncbi:MAG: four helix bundle protein [Patescibacteria group bacterium]|jgi:four helix bundle protein
MNKTKIKSFTDLNAWKEAHVLVIMIYKITKTFPKDELFGLINQLRRCAVSITSNIAEGFSRPTYKEKIKFYYTSLGSVTELQNQILVARDIEYLSNKDFQKIANQSITVHKLINGLIKKSKTFKKS